MKSFARSVLTMVALSTLAGPAPAQTIPPGQSCGGLFCDMGLLGRKVPLGPNGEPPSPAQMAAAEAADPHRLPCHDFLCRFAGQPDADAVPPPPPPAPVAETLPDVPSKHARKGRHKRVAKAEVAAPASPEPK